MHRDIFKGLVVFEGGEGENCQKDNCPKGHLLPWRAPHLRRFLASGPEPSWGPAAPRCLR